MTYPTYGQNFHRKPLNIILQQPQHVPPLSARKQKNAGIPIP